LIRFEPIIEMPLENLVARCTASHRAGNISSVFLHLNYRDENEQQLDDD
jgi:hypothetical protein